MAFCGGCGKKSDDKDNFCRGCGEKIVQQTVSVIQENAEIVKEEYRLSSVSKNEIAQSGGSHIGDQQKSGEWLEATVAHIMKYAGFTTKREERFVFNDSTGDHFEIDVLATDPNNEIFVECKDLQTLKMSEKIMYTLKGQLEDYRKRTSKNVIGILAMTAKDDGRNRGIHESLQKQNSFLWDGSFIEHLQNKMTELGNTDDFRSYILQHLEIFEGPKEKHEGDYDFMLKFSCYTIPPDSYVGKSFDVTNFIEDINSRLASSEVRIINKKFEQISDKNQVFAWKLTLDFSLLMNMAEIESFAKKHKKFTDKIKRRDEFHITCREYRNRLESVLQNTYGIRYEKKSKSMFDEITFEGQRIS
ncbi:hypothetical protein OAI77_01000 [Candidatus Nitrosopelagicus sp.]|jgi:hypothetical protein|nr:hypothetical protein [Candidatus Nitrosopelagicus sp.]